VQLGVGGEEGGEAGVDDVGGWGRVGEVCRRLGGGGVSQERGSRTFRPRWNIGFVPTD